MSDSHKYCKILIFHTHRQTDTYDYFYARFYSNLHHKTLHSSLSLSSNVKLIAVQFIIEAKHLFLWLHDSLFPTCYAPVKKLWIDYHKKRWRKAEKELQLIWFFNWNCFLVSGMCGLRSFASSLKMQTRSSVMFIKIIKMKCT